MTDYLVFQLYAPLAAWGTQAVGQERPIESHPSRSALLGLLAAALGIERSDEGRHQALSDACRFGIKLLTPGLALRDFHTTQVPPESRKVHHLCTRRDELRAEKLGTMLSFRSYRQDAASIVAATIESAEWTLKDLLAALQEPRYHLYLGRKACPPALPLNPSIFTAADLKSALDQYEPDNSLSILQKTANSSRPRYYWEAGMTSGMRHDYHSPRYDQPISRRRWQFAPRDEFVARGGE